MFEELKIQETIDKMNKFSYPQIKVLKTKWDQQLTKILKEMDSSKKIEQFNPFLTAAERRNGSDNFNSTSSFKTTVELGSSANEILFKTRNGNKTLNLDILDQFLTLPKESLDKIKKSLKKREFLAFPSVQISLEEIYFSFYEIRQRLAVYLKEIEANKAIEQRLTQLKAEFSLLKDRKEDFDEDFPLLICDGSKRNSVQFERTKNSYISTLLSSSAIFSRKSKKD